MLDRGQQSTICYSCVTDTPLVPAPSWLRMFDVQTPTVGSGFACATVFLPGFGHVPVCWGRGANDRSSAAPGLLSPPRTNVDTLSLCAGDGTLECWGTNSSASISAWLSVPPGKLWRRVACGFTHTCGIDVTNQMFCWGALLGQDGPVLSVPPARPSDAPSQAPSAAPSPAPSRAPTDAPNSNTYAPSLAPTGSGHGFRALVIGDGHMCGLLFSDQVER